MSNTGFLFVNPLQLLHQFGNILKSSIFNLRGAIPNNFSTAPLTARIKFLINLMHLLRPQNRSVNIRTDVMRRLCLIGQW